jgi:hypothetical protein
MKAWYMILSGSGPAWMGCSPSIRVVSGGHGAGYQLYGLERQSRKMPELQVRRICLKALDGDGRVQVFWVMPSCVLPYRAGYTDEVEKALFLRRLGVPFWA